MKRTTDWGAWISLLLVGGAGLGVAWRFAPDSLVESEALGREPPEQVAARSSPVAQPVAGAAANGAAHGAPLGYRLNVPDHTWVLSEALSEISDLTLAPDGESLWAVHDEKGTLFRISIKDGSVLQTIDFHKKGDFEGVAVVDGKVVAGRSDGVLFVVDPQNGQTTHFATPLGVACNLEGLAYEPGKSRLLLACKSPIGAKSKRAWAVYSLNLATKELQKEPVFLITRQAIEDYLARHPEQPELTSSIATQFDPSGIAIHPKSGQIYLISTRARLLMVLDPNGALLRIETLDRSIHPQPEGIAFSADGTLFISSEARGKRASLSRFSQVAP